MSDILRCPYCGGILEQSSIFNLNSYACTDLACKGYFMTATKDMWQELICTRKALDVALCSLQDIAESNGDFITGASTPLDEHEYADMMLKEIKRQMKIKTALEQKDK